MVLRDKTALAPALIGVLLVSCAPADDPKPVAEGSGAAFGQAPIDPCELVLDPGLAAGDESIGRIQTAIRGRPGGEMWLERLGWQLVDRARSTSDAGYYTLALQTANCLEQKHPAAPEALLLKAHTLHNQHRFAEAELTARELALRRGLWLDYAVLGDVLLERGAIPEATEAYQRMMEQRPGPEAYARAAQLRWLTGDLAGAITLMRLATRTQGSQAEPAAWLLARLAILELYAGNRAAASEQASAALHAVAEYPPALYAQGRLALADGQPADAIAPLRRAADLTGSPEYQWALLEALTAAGAHGEATAIAAALETAGEIVDRRTVALYRATHGRDPSRAVALATRELEDRRDIYTLDALAWSLYAAGRVAEAVPLVSQFLILGTADPRLYLHAAAILSAAGDTEQAALCSARARAARHVLLPSEQRWLETPATTPQPRDSHAMPLTLAAQR